MKKYIFTERNGIHVIDLHKSLKKIEEAYEEMRKIAEDGGKVLFVGTKKQAQGFGVNFVEEEVVGMDFSQKIKTIKTKIPPK